MPTQALADYMEGKRRAFPRFYFVSTADLLDILSNGNDPAHIQQHMSKCFQVGGGGGGGVAVGMGGGAVGCEGWNEASRVQTAKAGSIPRSEARERTALCSLRPWWAASRRAGALCQASAGSTLVAPSG